MPTLSLDATSLRRAYAEKTLSPVDVAEAVLDRIIERGDDSTWIYKVPGEELLFKAGALAALSDDERARMPLFGLPFSVKDCIDMAGLPTTCACPDFAYVAEKTNLAIQRVIDAGALFVGKTNLDQFATGVVGVRSPYGVPRNPVHADYIPGGSSSGAAVSVSAGLCSFAFGTDTGGSGRVPASYTNVVGMKPTLGLLSHNDNVGPSKMFDTISLYTLTVDDARLILDTCAAVDPLDPFGRAAPAVDASAGPGPKRIGVPKPADREFFGNGDAEALYEAGLAALHALGHDIVEIDFALFTETSHMMFEGPLLVERYAAFGKFIEGSPESVEKVVRDVILPSGRYTAVELLDALYTLRENVIHIRKNFETVDVIAVPTVGTVYTVAEVQADPIRTNATNGHYMNFVNMSDLAAIAVPNGFLPSGVSMGVTFIGPAFSEPLLAAVAGSFHRVRVPTLGATTCPFPE